VGVVVASVLLVKSRGRRVVVLVHLARILLVKDQLVSIMRIVSLLSVYSMILKVTYELFIFALMEVASEILGAYFNYRYLNQQVTLFRLKHIYINAGYRMIELLSITFVMAIITFVSCDSTT
jgi:hypothetical protein